MKAILTPPEGARQLLSDHTDMDRSPRRLVPADSGGIPVELPDDAYFQYQWRDEGGRTLPDPTGAETAPSIWYGTVNVLKGPGYRQDELAAASEDAVPAGQLNRHRLDSQALGQQRRVNVYTPPGQESASLPALLVQDGTAFFRVGKLAALLDAAIADGLPPARLVFLEPVSRDREYRFSASYRDFVLEELLPQLTELAGPTGGLCLLGASLGGLASATLALAEPDRFTGVATFSGAFLGSPQNPDPYESPDEWVRSRIEEGDRVPPRWFVGTGSLEWLHGPNRRLARALEAAGAEVSYLERPAGHNWPNWRDMLGTALRHVLDG